MLSNIIYAVGTQIPYIFCERKNLNSYKEKEQVYVVGNGWASYYFVKYLDKSKFNPIIIAPNSKVLNTPKLVERVLDSKAQVEFPNPYGEKILDMVEDIDVKEKTLITKSGSTYHFNKVVFAIGSEPNDFGIPGVLQHTYKFKTIQDADTLRKKLDILYTDSKVYIVGSGITGIELGTNITKLEGSIGSNGLNIKIIDGLDAILPGYNPITKQEITAKINGTYPNIELILNSMVKSIDLGPDGSKLIHLLNSKSNAKSNYRLWPYSRDIIVWTGGVRFCGYGKTKLFDSLNKLTPIKPRGLEVEPDFSIKEHPNIYCLGDMVSNAGPPSAQNAKNQGIWLAEYFNSNFDNQFIKSNPYKVKSNGKTVHLSNNTYLESEYYSGFIPKFIDKIIEWFY
jgi:NADH dehydrogenase FAD-containing subunit